MGRAAAIRPGARRLVPTPGRRPAITLGVNRRLDEAWTRIGLAQPEALRA